MVPSLSIGIILSLLASIIKSGKDITTKLGVENADEFVTGWSTRFFAIPVFAIGVYLTQSFAVPTTQVFWIALLINISLLTITTLLIAKAYKVSDISVIAPLMSFVPIMTVLPAWILLEEVPSALAGIGISLVSIGAYVLGVQSANEGLTVPIKRLLTDRGAQYIGVMLLLVGVIPSVDKIGLQQSSPMLWVLSTHIGMAIALGAIVYLKSRDTARSDFASNKTVLIALGLINAFLWIAQINAYAVLPVAYVQAIKRGSILLSILAGYYLFDETNIKTRLVGGSIILSGVIAVIFGT